MEVSGQLRALAALPPGKAPPPRDGWLGPQNRPGCCGEERNLALPEVDPGSSRP
jgi:hypothetical protein